MIGDLGTPKVLAAIAIILTAIWYYLVANYNYWKKLGVPGPKPSLIFGNWKNITLVRRSFVESLQEVGEEFPGEPMIGVYQHRTPLLLLRDPELIKDVFIKDFTSFSERAHPMHEKLEPLSAHLFNLETKRWRSLRPKLSPAFTSGKMKHMFALILECGEYFEKYVGSLVEKGEIIDCREIAAKFTTDVIGSCAFGLQMNALADEDSEFRKMGRKVFDVNYKLRFLMTLRASAPWLYDWLGKPVTPAEVTEFFMSSIKQTIEYRKKNDIQRGDLVDMLLELRNSPQTDDFELTDSLLTAQAFVFFLAGFETSATTISHALLELSQQQDVQEKLRQEIIESLKKHNGNISYDSVKEMKYLHKVFQETLRLRPPVGILFRKAVKDYTFRGTNITIPKGQLVWIPIWEIQHNPEYYPEPEVFDPERFTDEMCKTRHPMTYLPFGDGPRNCIGERFAVYQTKLGLIKMLANYKVEVSDKVQLPYKPNAKSFLLQPEGGIHLKFSKIN